MIFPLVLAWAVVASALVAEACSGNLTGSRGRNMIFRCLDKGREKQ
jgi:hypothetical protein